MLIGDRRVQDRVDVALWQRPDMRAALAARDIAGVFRLLQRVGVSQRRIAALTGQSQSEISEILGGRHVVSYDVLARIADGLGVPRGHLGLAYDDATAQLIGVTAAGASPDDEDPSHLVARVTQLTMGEPPVDPGELAQPLALTWAAAPDHVGLADVSRLEEVTAQLRATDYEFGGGACRDAVLAQLGWAQQLLNAQVGETAVRALHIAVADLHHLAGWTSFDVGMIGPARRHMSRALEHARFADEQSLVAKVLYALGRVHLHHGWHGQALRLFQLGLVQAQQTEYGRAEALLHANLGWAHAANGDVRQALASADRAREAYSRSELDEAPYWLRFFDSAELQALRGMTLAHLPDSASEYRAQAIERFTLSNAMRELPMARSRTFELIALSWLLLDEGATEQAVQVGHQAVDLAGQVRSQRVLDRFAPLRASMGRRPDVPDIRDLAQRVKALRGAGPAQPDPVAPRAGVRRSDAGAAARPDRVASGPAEPRSEGGETDQVASGPTEPRSEGAEADQVASGPTEPRSEGAETDQVASGPTEPQSEGADIAQPDRVASGPTEPRADGAVPAQPDRAASGPAEPRSGDAAPALQ